MKRTSIPTLCIILFLFINNNWISGQNLDSLLNNKRIYNSVNIGDLPQPRIDGLLDDEIWSLGEYNPGSTIYLVWAHDRSDWEGAYNPVSDIVEYLLRASGNNVFMFKLNFWFSL